MYQLLYILVSVIIAAFIGGLTNYLAIKMLFHPRNKIIIAGKKMPFTPGLIPKRKEEIARSLGEVVGNYLVTSQGLATMLKKSEFQSKFINKINEWTTKWSNSEETLQELAGRLWGEEEVHCFQQRLSGWLQEVAKKGVSWLYDWQDQSSIRLAHLIPEWTEEKKLQLVEWITNYIIAEMKQEVKSANGDRLIRQFTQQVMEQAGGLLGTIAGIFMDEDKIVRKVRGIINDRLDSPKVNRWIREFLYRKVSDWEQKRLSEVVEMIAGQDGKDWIIEKLDSILDWDQWVGKGSQVQIKTMIGSNQDWIQEKAPVIADFLLTTIAHNIEKLVASIELPKLVEEQVNQFPVERLEQIILNVSGREFRAITWLGAFLGGLIGLLQATMLLWFF